MQVQAIIEAAIDVDHETIEPEIMIPLVGHEEELVILKELVIQTADLVMEKRGKRVRFKVGTMIEVPRAALVADDIAKHAEFFSFGTNDLTQMTLGYSRDDAGKFMGAYRQQGILPKDPFESLDQKGVGRLIKLATDNGRSTRADLKLGICGEHGGEPKAIKFCHDLGLDYVSCSPFRVPGARLAAAQANINRAL